MRIARWLLAVCLACGLCVAGGFAGARVLRVRADATRPANDAAQADQNVKAIDVTAKKYEFNPSPIRVKQGAKVQLEITALDHTHGFQINLYPDGAPTTGDPGLVFTSKQDCVEIEKGAAVTVEFVAHAPGTYSFKCCKRCGLGHGGMKGQLIVEP
jgi:cytochrome c oxidase subunit II